MECPLPKTAKKGEKDNQQVHAARAGTQAKGLEGERKRQREADHETKEVKRVRNTPLKYNCVCDHSSVLYISGWYKAKVANEGPDGPDGEAKCLLCQKYVHDSVALVWQKGARKKKDEDERNKKAAEERNQRTILG